MKRPITTLTSAHEVLKFKPKGVSLFANRHGFEDPREAQLIERGRTIKYTRLLQAIWFHTSNVCSNNRRESEAR